MNKNAITLSTLCARLERAIGKEVGKYGLQTLLYGWRMKYGLIRDNTISMRRSADGEAWLSLREAQHFSTYAGYDLTHD